MGVTVREGAVPGMTGAGSAGRWLLVRLVDHDHDHPAEGLVAVEQGAAGDPANRETVKGRELGRDRLRHATKLLMAKDLGRLVRMVKARSTRRSARGGQNLSARRVGNNTI